MTPDELAELDRKVAEAIGGKIEKWFWRFPEWDFMPAVSNAASHAPDCREDIHDVWMPSVNWEHAMFAAEEVGLFDTGDGGWDYLRKVGVFQWAVGDVLATMEFGEPVVEFEDAVTADTGPLAICKSILALKEKP